MNNIVSDTQLSDWLIQIYQDFHQYPETAFNEIRTTRRIKEILTDLNIELIEPEDLKTGVIAIIRSGKPGKTIAIRADIDALPVIEETKLAYASKNTGVMHACGHDAHIAIVIGAARTLANLSGNENFSGNIKFIFQPAEEILLGAKKMLANHALANPNVDRIISCHVTNILNTGQADTYDGPVFAAADTFTLTFEGKGAHAGYPHKSIDPIMAGCDFVSGCLSLTRRHVSPVDTCVITTATFNGGDTSNVIPNTATLSGSIRTYMPEVRERVIEHFKLLIKSIELNHGVTSRLDLQHATPAVINDKNISHILTGAATKIMEKKNIIKTESATGSEDFAWYLKDIPGAMFFLGSKNPLDEVDRPAHASNFLIDPASLIYGTSIMVETCKDYLNFSEG